MLGTEELAEQAAEIVENGSYESYENDKGFEYLNSGGARVALLGPDGNVYKVDRYDSQAVDEEEFFSVLRGFGVPWIPDTTVWNVEGYSVTAMPRLFQPWGKRFYYSVLGLDGVSASEENVERWRQMQAIVHQDLKSANVGVDENGLLFLLDGGVESSYGLDEGSIRRLLSGKELDDDDEEEEEDEVYYDPDENYDEDYPNSCDCNACKGN